MIIYQDDIYIGASRKNELEQKKEHVLKKLKKAGMRKTEINVNSIAVW